MSTALKESNTAKLYYVTYVDFLTMCLNNKQTQELFFLLILSSDFGVDRSS